MPILLNKEQVAAEIIELARIKVAIMLNLPVSVVNAQWGLKDGVPVPEFGIDIKAPEVVAEIARKKELGIPMGEQEIVTSLGAVWRWLKTTLSERLVGLQQRRG